MAGWSRRKYDALMGSNRSDGTRAHRRASIRTVLVIGFAVVFGLWVFSGYELVRRLHERADAERSTADLE